MMARNESQDTVYKRGLHPSVTRVFYRLVQSAQPTVWDFMSLEARGVVCGPDDDPDIWRGISVQATEKQIRKKAMVVRRCAFYAVIELPMDCDVRVERTLQSRGHHTLWADPEILIGYVSDVQRV